MPIFNQMRDVASPVPLDAEQTRALCDALRPVIGSRSFADVMQAKDRSPNYRVLKWCSRTTNPLWNDPRPQLRAILEENLPSKATVSLNSAGLRVPVRRDVPCTAWQAPRVPLTAEQKRARAEKARATRLSNAAYYAAIKPSRPDRRAPDTLGWRVFRWDQTLNQLVSPHQGTAWPEDGVLEAENWPIDSAEVLRNKAGIHAVRMPKNWKEADPSHNHELSFGANLVDGIDGIVERFGRAVVGDNGWRAERVVIRRVRAPSTEIGLAIELAYPTIDVFYPESVG